VHFENVPIGAKLFHQEPDERDHESALRPRLRFSLLQLFAWTTGICVLIAILVQAPVLRVVLGAVALGSGLIYLTARGRNYVGRWFRATVVAWIGLALWTYLELLYPYGSRRMPEWAEATGPTFFLACFIGAAVAAAVGRR
jgi:hypothetical protein